MGRGVADARSGAPDHAWSRAWSRAWSAAVSGPWAGGCPGCAAPGGAVCCDCRRLLVGRGLRRRVLADGTPCVAAASYAAPVRGLVLAAKEGGRRDVRDVLAHALSRAVAEAGWSPLRASPRLVLVSPPTRVPTRWRRRGDPVADLAGGAAARLRGAGADVSCARVLRARRTVADQSGLGAGRRWANLDGAFAARGPSLAPLAGADVVVVDDVVTTGATAVEAAGALRVAGVRVIGVAAVATRG